VTDTVQAWANGKPNFGRCLGSSNSAV